MTSDLANYAGDHPNTASSTFNLAGLLLNMERLEEAGEHYAAALAMYRRLDLEDSSNFGIVLYRYAYYLERAGQLQVAIESSKEAVELLEKHLGAEHSYVGKSRMQYARQLYEAGEDLELALDQNLLALECLNSTADARHEWLAETYQLQAKIELARGRGTQAVEAQRQALAMYQKLSPPAQGAVARAESELGELLTELGEHEEALEHLMAAFERASGDAKTPAATLAEFARRVAALHASRSEQKLADQWQDRAREFEADEERAREDTGE